MKILFLYSEVMNYTVTCLEALSRRTENIEIHVIRWDTKKLTPFIPDSSEKIHYYLRSDFDDKKIKAFIFELKPDLCFVSGWMDKLYLKAARQLRKKKVPVIGGLDNQWNGSLRQKIGSLVSAIKVKPFFSHLMTAGSLQYKFARKLGYPEDKVLDNLYSANVSLFETAYLEGRKWKKRILFIGRFNEVKGIQLLLESFIELSPENPEWELILIGNGPLRDKIPPHHKIVVKDFMDSHLLMEESKNASVFCLPSKKEAWGVVIHEFAASGLPLLTSSVCGANTKFMKHGYNGYIFESENKSSLKKYLKILMNTPLEDLMNMGERSHKLSKNVTPEIWASTILSVLEQ